MKTKDFKAKDIYPKWVEYVKLATSSITVISPYVDNTVKNLLANSQIQSELDIKLITRIDSDTIFDKPYQIRALISCIKKNVKIFNLSELHAKLLIVDNKYISIGSQNFTSRGKINKETSMISLHPFNETKFLDTINEWIDSSIQVDQEYLESLENGLEKYRKRIEELRNIHSNDFEAISKSYFTKKKEELIRELEKQKQNTTLRFASENIYLSMTHRNDITTLLADSEYNLQQWKVDNDVEKLVRLWYYPMFNVENSGIAFGRLAEKRISFFKTNFSFPPKHIEGYHFFIELNCPISRTNEVNLEIKFNFFDKNYTTLLNSTLGYYYNGSTCTRKSENYSDETARKIINERFLKNHNSEELLLKNYFREVDLKTIGISIDKFLHGRRYKLYVIQFQENPIIVCEKLW